MSARTGLPPRVTWIYGLLGLLPFFASCAASLLGYGDARVAAQMVLLAYAALILSFLGGARWGVEITHTPVRPTVISASMAPTVFAFAVVAAGAVPLRWRLLAMALGLAAQWAWDVRSRSTPRWYPMLRHVLTAGALVCLFLSAMCGHTP